MKLLVFVAALNLASQPTLTAQQVRQNPVKAGSDALSQLADDIVGAYRPIASPLPGAGRLDELLVRLKPHGTHVRGLCERQQLRIEFKPKADAAAELAALAPDRAFYADPEVRARRLAVANQYIPLAGYVAGSGASGDDDTACAALPERVYFVEAPSAAVADEALALFDGIQAQAKDGRLQFGFTCTLDGRACPDPAATFRQLLAADLDQADRWVTKGHADGVITEGELSGRLTKEAKDWWASVTALNGKPTRVELHVAVPAPS